MIVGTERITQRRKGPQSFAETRSSGAKSGFQNNAKASYGGATGSVVPVGLAAFFVVVPRIGLGANRRTLLGYFRGRPILGLWMEERLPAACCAGLKTAATLR